MCGIIGITSKTSVVNDLYEGLLSLQHRGQDSTGITTLNEEFHSFRKLGYVRDAYTPAVLGDLKGNKGIGHVRYATTGDASDVQNAQPFLVNSPYGIALVHNGNLTNTEELREELLNVQFHCNSDSDTEVLLGILAHELLKLSGDDFFQVLKSAVKETLRKVKGGYSVIGIIAGKGMFAFRDPHGIRPLIIGKRNKDYIIASEDTPFNNLDFWYESNVGAGELIFISDDGLQRSRITNELFTPCAFEYVYFARPDAYINGISVYGARCNLGQNLAKKWKQTYPDIVPDIVVPVPFTSNPIALSFANEIGVRYSEAIYRNSFIGRTFLMNRETNRTQAVIRKLSPQVNEIKNTTVLIVDDSIVRGNTSKEVVKMLKRAGARKVYYASATPPVKYPDFYGIDIPTEEELIGSYMSEEGIRSFIDADILLFQSIEDFSEAILRGQKSGIDRLSMPYLDGNYVV